MNKPNCVALATFFAFSLLASPQSLAVDSNRSSTLLRNAPAWAQPGANSANDPASGLNRPAAPLSRDRNSTNLRVAPTWTDPSLPAIDPLRSNPWQTDNSFPNNGSNDGFGNNGFNNNGLGPSVTNPNDPSAPQPTWQKWRLGIYPQDTDTGVLITQVVPGSAAQRAGLERNDRIVSVHGYQVGYVNGTLFDCGQEFERHADAQGWVRVLVQNNRDGKLLNMPIQLDPRHQGITGTVAYRDRSALPQNAILNVELREVLSFNSQPITLTRQSFTTERHPIAFNLDYDPTQIDPRRNYVLHANITSGGRQIYALQQDAPIFGNNGSQNLQLVVNRTSSILPGGGQQLSRTEQLAQIGNWFRDYLRREPRAQELYVWEAHLARGGSLTDAQLQILSTPEFYYQSNADDAEYVRRMFQLVTNRQPSQQEVAQWVNRLQFHNRLRPEMAREFLAMARGQNTHEARR